MAKVGENNIEVTKLINQDVAKVNKQNEVGNKNNNPVITPVDNQKDSKDTKVNTKEAFNNAKDGAIDAANKTPNKTATDFISAIIAKSPLSAPPPITAQLEAKSSGDTDQATRSNLQTASQQIDIFKNLVTPKKDFNQQKNDINSGAINLEAQNAGSIVALEAKQNAVKDAPGAPNPPTGAKAIEAKKQSEGFA